MDCEKVSDLLGDYIEGMLGSSIKVEFEDHIGRCERCQRELVNYRVTLDMLHSIDPIEVSANFTENVMRRIEAFEAGRKALTFAAIATLLRIHRKTIVAGFATFALAFGISASLLHRLASKERASFANQAPGVEAYVIKEVVQPVVVPHDTTYGKRDGSIWDEFDVHGERYVFPVSSENRPF